MGEEAAAGRGDGAERGGGEARDEECGREQEARREGVPEKHNKANDNERQVVCVSGCVPIKFGVFLEIMKQCWLTNESFLELRTAPNR